MNKICLVGKGETIEKLKFKIGFDVNTQILKSEDIGEFVLLEGDKNDEISLVENYHPIFIQKNNQDSLTDLKSIGYKCEEYGDIVLAFKQLGIKYVVKPMETIIDISKKFNISTDEIVKLNKLTSDKLFIGQILII